MKRERQSRFERNQVRLRAKKRLWRERLAAGKCKYCGKQPKPAKGAKCGRCRESESLAMARRWRRRKRKRIRDQVPTAKQWPAIRVLTRRPSWTLRGFAAARYPAGFRKTQACGRGIGHGIAVTRIAAKVLGNLAKMGLVQEEPARVYQLTVAGWRVVSEDRGNG